jgi:hypothetical protein
MPHPMKNLKIMIRLIPYAFLTVVIFAQNKQDKIIGIWEFQTITTLFNSEPEETLIINKDINNSETLTIRDDGSFSFRGIYESMGNAGIGTWTTEENHLILNVTNQKIVSNYEHKNNILFLTIFEAETNNYYGSNSVIKYTKRLIRP